VLGTGVSPADRRLEIQGCDRAIKAVGVDNRKATKLVDMEELRQ
jgi:hypothetical protein